MPTHPEEHRPPPTQAEIAKHLGLSRATVSMALRNNALISREVRSQVNSAAEKLGYRPDPVVATLMASLRRSRSGARKHVALAVVHESGNGRLWREIPFFRCIHDGIVRQAFAQGYGIEEFCLGPAGLPAERLARVLRARNIPGIILAPLPARSDSHMKHLEDFALSTINYSVQSPAVHRACINHSQNMSLAWHELVARGYKRIGLVHNAALGVRNDQGYLGAFLAQSFHTPRHQRVHPLIVNKLEELDAGTLRTWAAKAKPEVVIVTDARVYVPIALKTLEIPNRIGLVSMELTSAPAGTTGVCERTDLVGTAATDLIISQIHRNERGVPMHPRTILVAGEWRDGNTLRKNR